MVWEAIHDADLAKELIIFMRLAVGDRAEVG